MVIESPQGLNAEWLERAQQKISEANAGEYTLKQLFGYSWPSGPEARAIGSKFKYDVGNGNLIGLEYLKDTSAHAAVYRIF